MAAVSAAQAELEHMGAAVAFVHLGDANKARAVFALYGLENTARISDPEQVLYRAFTLRRGGIGDFLHPISLWRGLKWIWTYGAGRPDGDAMQMPGVFVVHRRRIVEQHIHRHAADNPEYAALLRRALARIGMA